MSTACIRLVPTILLLAALLPGCSTTPRFNEHFGAAVRANLAAQAIDPAAAASTNPAAGIDGAVARASHERYQRSFKDVEPTMDKPLVGAGGAR
jgi:type IV pilus biogenesis protein CpaD/CtpE